MPNTCHYTRIHLALTVRQLETEMQILKVIRAVSCTFQYVPGQADTKTGPARIVAKPELLTVGLQAHHESRHSFQN